MKVFLSWAGIDSQYIASTLRDWLPQVLQSVDPWMSTEIEKGESWDTAISDGLNESTVGILCLTKDSISSNYLHYEAGAIANVKNAKVCTFLYGIKNADVKQPLGRFQHTRFEKEEVFKLLSTINGKLNEANERSLTELQLRKALDLNWDELVESLDKTPLSESTVVERPDRELLEEILQMMRTFTSLTSEVDLSKSKNLTGEHLFSTTQLRHIELSVTKYVKDYLKINNIDASDAPKHLEDVFRDIKPTFAPEVFVDRAYFMNILKGIMIEDKIW